MVYYRLPTSFVISKHLEYVDFRSIQKLQVIVITPTQLVSRYHVVSQVFIYLFF